MQYHFRQLRINDPRSPWHDATLDLRIHGGRIVEGGTNLSGQDGETLVDCKGSIVSPGWVDPFAQVGEPGEEYRESFGSLAAAASAGGFTDVLIQPNTIPAMDGAGALGVFANIAGQLPARLHPIGAVTKGCKGETLAEMYDMHSAGAVAFSDGQRPLQNSLLLQKALEYLLPTGATLIQMPIDGAMAAVGLMHEGLESTRLGLPGISPLAEELAVHKALEIAMYTGGKLHLTGISTRKSLELVRAAKKVNTGISVSVSPAHLLYTDGDMAAYDSLFKTAPPLRPPSDREALREGLLDGTIDCIATHHSPHHADNKERELDSAVPGMTTLQTAFSMLMEAMPELSPQRLAGLLSLSARKLFGLPSSLIAEGEVSNLTIYQPDVSWHFTAANNRSLSINSPLLGKQLKGKVVGTFLKGNYFSNHD